MPLQKVHQTHRIVNVFNTGQRASFGIDFSIKQSRGDNISDHIARVTINRHIITCRQLIGGRLLYSQVRFLNLGQSVCAMVAQPAYKVSGIVIVIRMTAERRRIAQIFAVFPAVYSLIDRIHSF